MRKDKFPKTHSTSEIEGRAERLRLAIGAGGSSYFNIIETIENGFVAKFPDFFLEVLPVEEMGETEAHTAFNPARISIRQDVYDSAYVDDVRSRFTVAHELGHLFLHWGYARPRLAPSMQGVWRSRSDARLEAEANKFAGAFLMPRAIASKFEEPIGLAKLCRVSPKAATARLNDLWSNSGKLTQTAVHTLFGNKR